MRVRKIAAFACATMLAANVTVSAAGLSVCTHAGQTWDVNATITAAKEMGSEWIRDELRWKQVEWTKGNFLLPVDAGWSSWVNKALADGIKPICILGFGNGVYQENGDEYTSVHLPTYGTKTGTAAVKEQEYWDAWERYVRLVVTTYKGKIPVYEIWNEPNITPFCNDVNPTNYAKLYIATRNIIKSIDPDAIALCGCVTGAENTEISYINSVLDYIKNNGGFSQIDAFSIHLYVHGQTPEGTYLSALDNLYEKTFALKGYTGDIWMTENGTYTGTYSKAVSEQTQAAFTIRQTVIWDWFLKAKNIKGYNFWYDLKNDGNDLSDCENNFGLMYSDFTPKPAYTAARLFNTMTKGLSLNSVSQSSDKYVADYTDGKKHTFIVWKSGSGTGTVTVNIPYKNATVYALDGTVKQTVNTTGSKTFSVTSSPLIIHSAPALPEISSGTTVSYNAQTKRVSVLGTINNFDTEAELSFLAVPHGTVLSNGLDPARVGYIGAIKTKTASFSHSFGLPAWYCGKTDIYVSGLGMNNGKVLEAGVPNNQYVYVASIDTDKSTMSASAAFRNFASEDMEATVVVAAYKSGVLTDVKLEKVTIPSGTYGESVVKTAAFATSGEVDTVKAFVWSDMTDIVPLIGAVTK